MKAWTKTAREKYAAHTDKAGLASALTQFKALRATIHAPE